MAPHCDRFVTGTLGDQALHGDGGASDMRKLVGFNVRRMTQEQFAERSGFSQQYISDLEHGRRNPTIVSLYELALALGATLVELLAPIDGDGTVNGME